MTQIKNASLIQMAEVFPTWPHEDLMAALNEAGGDVYIAISRISEGHFSKWSGSSKKIIVETRPLRTRDNRNSFTNRNQGSKNTNTSYDRNQRFAATREQRPQRKPAAPVKNTLPAAPSDLAWGDSDKEPAVQAAAESESVSKGPAPVSVINSVPVVLLVSEPKASFAEAAASSPVEKRKKEKKLVSIKVEEVITTESVNVFATDETETIESSSLEATSVVEESATSVASPIAALIASPIDTNFTVTVPVPVFENDDDEIVSMPARATPSLTMEQPAVVLPIRTNLRSNLNVRFGYEISSDDSTPVSAVVIEEAAPPVKTPITVSALESTFAILSSSPVVPSVKSPEPILSPPSPEAAAWNNSRTSVGYGNFARNRQHGGWDYEPTPILPAPVPTGTPTASQNGSFGPAPGFSGPTSPAVPPQRFVSRAAAQYEHTSVYNPAQAQAQAHPHLQSQAPPSNNSRFSPYEESNHLASNNVSQYYTTRPVPQTNTGYSVPVYRGNNNNSSLNASSSRYGTPNRPYYQPQHPHHHQQGTSVQQQPIPSGHYSPYNPHQNYLSSYHGYPQYPPQHAEHYSSPQQQQQQHQPHQQQSPQQPYYQPYQPPNQYLSNSNMHHHHHPHHNA